MPVIDELRRERITDFNVTIGYNLRAWRLERGISQERLAKQSDMSQSQLARVEQGERSITLKQALTICQQLDIEIANLA